MEYEYCPPGLKEKYENEKFLKRKYGISISKGMHEFLSALEAAENAYDIKITAKFCMEHKKQNLNSYYSVSLDKKKSKWRLMLQMLNEMNEVIKPNDNEKDFLKNVKKIRIREMSEHYVEY